MAIQETNAEENPAESTASDCAVEDSTSEKKQVYISVETSLRAEDGAGEEKDAVKIREERRTPIWHDALKSPDNIAIFSPSLDIGNPANLHGLGTHIFEAERYG
jgi:hypothetical protein